MDGPIFFRVGCRCGLRVAALILWLAGSVPLGWSAEVVAELTSAHHHIRVVDEGPYRVLSFDGSMESRILRANPLQGHFEYTRYFEMAWLWHQDIRRVLVVGLGGGTTQMRWAEYQPDLEITTVELDPMVVTVARQYFGFETGDRQKVVVEDGRSYLRRTQETYDVILMDAYTSHRYGSSLPQHLATREFFAIARERLTDKGVLCYNVMGNWQGPESRLVAALHNTLKTSFPQVYFFPSTESRNVVLVATTLERRYSFNDLQVRGSILARTKEIFFPGFRERIYAVRTQAAYGTDQAPVLTDDHAPIEGLIQKGAATTP